MARNNETITLQINVSGNGNLAIRQMNSSLGTTASAASTASSSVANIGSSAAQSSRQVSSLSSSMAGLASGIAIGGIALQVANVSSEWEKLNAIMQSTSNNTEQVKKDFEDIRSIEGISFFDKEDIAEGYNLLRSQGIDFSKDLQKTILDTARATSQNLVTVTEQFRAVLNGEEGTLDDYFKKVVKTTDGILVEYTDKSGELKVKLLKDSKDLSDALNEQFSGTIDNINKTASGQVKVLQEQFFNVISKEYDKLFLSTTKFYQKSFKQIGEFYDKISGLNKEKKKNLYGFSEEEIKAGEEAIKKHEEEKLKKQNEIKEKSKSKEKSAFNKELEKRKLLIDSNNEEIITGKINSVNRQIEILQAGENKKILILEDSRNKELQNIKNPELISAINQKYDIELGLLKDSIEKKKQLTEQQTLGSIDSRISGLGEGFADTTQGLSETEKNEIKLEEINTFYDNKNALLEEKLALEILTKEQFAETEVELERNKAERIIAVRQQVEDSKMQELSNIKTGLDGIGSIFSSFDKIVGKQSKESFEAQKAFGIASATINAYMGASKALAEGGAYLGPILAGVQLASGLAQVAQISSQQYQPKFHDGGVITNGGALSNEVDATLQTGEGVLSRRGMSALDKLNRGEGETNGSVEVIVVQNMEEALERQLTSRAGRSMIKEISNG